MGSDQNLTWDVRGFEFPEQPVASPSDIDEFLGDGAAVARRTEILDEEEEEGAEESCGDAEESKKFWETQHQLLQSTICRTTSMETRIRNATREAMEEIQTAGESVCRCGRPTAASGGCRGCLMREVCSRLQNKGYDVAICKSQWRNSPCFPSGEHTFLDVLDSSSKKGDVRVIIEPTFRSEFEMARASEDYNHLMQRLPEVFVGKVERLQAVVKILCAAAKKCMKEKRMHLGPWRKQKYMQAKWLSSSKRQRPASPLPAATLSMASFSGRPQRPRASMLTVDLRDKLSSMHRTSVEVV